MAEKPRRFQCVRCGAYAVAINAQAAMKVMPAGDHMHRPRRASMGSREITFDDLEVP